MRFRPKYAKRSTMTQQMISFIILSKMTHIYRVLDVISPKIRISNRKIIELENFQVKNLHFYISNINLSNKLKIAQLE